MPQHETPSCVFYANVRLLDPASGLDVQGALLTQDETIVDFGPDLTAPEGADIIDCDGLCLAPGLVDARVQLREPGEEQKETLRTGGEAAVAGGVTSMICLPNTQPAIDDAAVLELIARRARLIGLSKVYAYGAATKRLEGKELAEIGLLAEAGALAFTDGVKAIADAQVMRRVLSYASTYDLMIVQHPEEPALAKGGQITGGEMATRLGLSGIPVLAEAIMLERDMRLVSMTGARYHAAHVSTAEGLDVIRKAKKQGLRVTCDTAPPYFALTLDAIGDYRTYAKLSPPLREEKDRQAVVKALKDGTIDVIVSDHAPQDQDSKRQPFAQADFGGVGLETLLAVTLELFHNNHLSLLETLALITSRPAKLFGLKDAGRLERGGPADLVLFDLNRPWTIDTFELRGKSKNTPFDGRSVQGVVVRTVIDGRTVFSL